MSLLNARLLLLLTDIFIFKEQLQCRVDDLKKTDNAHFLLLCSLTYSTFSNVMCPLFETIPILSTSILELSLSNNIPHHPPVLLQFHAEAGAELSYTLAFKKCEIICTGCYSNNAFSI